MNIVPLKDEGSLNLTQAGGEGWFEAVFSIQIQTETAVILRISRVFEISIFRNGFRYGNSLILIKTTLRSIGSDMIIFPGHIASFEIKVRFNVQNLLPGKYRKHFDQLLWRENRTEKMFRPTFSDERFWSNALEIE